MGSGRELLFKTSCMLLYDMVKWKRTNVLVCGKGDRKSKQ